MARSAPWRQSGGDSDIVRLMSKIFLPVFISSVAIAQTGVKIRLFDPIKNLDVFTEVVKIEGVTVDRPCLSIKNCEARRAIEKNFLFRKSWLMFRGTP